MVTLNALALVVALTTVSPPEDGQTVLLDFTSPSCVPCQTMEPTLGRLARDGYPLRKIDVTQEPNLAARFQVTGVPCFVMIANGREVDRVVGACSHARLVAMFAATRTKPSKDVSASSSAPIRRPSESSSEIVRAQSPDSRMATVAPAPARDFDPRQHAFNATVRLRIEDANGHSIGTGTIVDTHGHEALAITCGHIFRDSAGQGRILVDLFSNGSERTVEGTLISYDLTRDVGLVSLTPGVEVSPVKIAPAGHRFGTGDVVFSVGCDNGRAPSLRDSRITSIDRYLGPPNIEATGEPAQGRSGGGLFSRDGFLIGICNHGDPRDNEGIYASLPTIHWELDRVGQRRLYEPNADAIAKQGLSRSRIQPRQLIPNSAAAARIDPTVVPASFTQNEPTRGDTEVICIVRSRGNPQMQERVYVLDQPSSELLDRLAKESRGASGANQVATRPVPPVSARPNAMRSTAPGQPVVRAQSNDKR